MSDVAMLTAQVENLQAESNQLKDHLKQLTAQLRANQQCVQEYLQSNIGLRASGMVLEDTARNLSMENVSLKERVSVLEEEKIYLENKVNEINSLIIDNETSAH